jgi:general secretion pathway protein C
MQQAVSTGASTGARLSLTIEKSVRLRAFSRHNPASQANEGILRVMKFDSTRVLSPGSMFRLLEIIVLVFLAVQTARLFWITATPLGPIGEPRRGVQTMQPSAGFDPFFRLNAAAGPATVTSLPLKLFGVRVDEAMGGGSAIIEADGVQSSFGVGEDVLPGVKLKQVMFDSVLIDRNGASEQLFLDQSIAAPVARPAASVPAAVPTPPAVPTAIAPPQGSAAPPPSANAATPEPQGTQIR